MKLFSASQETRQVKQDPSIRKCSNIAHRVKTGLDIIKYLRNITAKKSLLYCKKEEKSSIGQ